MKLLDLIFGLTPDYLTGKILAVVSPVKGDNTKQLATAEFTQQALRNKRAITTGTTALAYEDHGLVLVDASGGNVTINLPAATVAVGYRFRRIDTSANTVTINRAGSDTIEAAGTAVTLVGNAAYRELISDGTSKWRSPLIYDQGTFTPTARGTGTTGSFGYTVQSGRYERIGQRVFYTANIGWSSSTGTGGLRIKVDGIPCAPVSGHQAPVVIRADGLNYGSGKQLLGYVTSTNQEIHLEAADPAGGATADVAIDTSVGQLIISGSYPTDD